MLRLWHFAEKIVKSLEVRIIIVKIFDRSRFALQFNTTLSTLEIHDDSSDLGQESIARALNVLSALSCYSHVV